jgi:fructoselysine and glucoselysine-specific PTS system IID component
MIPVLKRLYGDDKEKMAAALKRHLEFMACTPHIVTLLAGITVAMEEKNQQNEDFDESTISSVKLSLMGPLAGVGDSFFWGTLLTIAIGVGVSFASQGNIAGPILFILIINVPGFLSRYYCLKGGYKSGTKFFGDLSESSIVGTVTKSASILGLMVVGSMIASTISLSIPIEIGVVGATSTVQSFIDQIMPSFLPALLFGLIYKLLGKKIKPTTILIGIIVVSCLGTYLHIF